jgi:hypothetical protein
MVSAPLDEPARDENDTGFRRELESLINKYSMENVSDTPDFIIAKYLLRSLWAFDAAVLERSAWFRPADVVE